ncbi:MAG: hypothetical protein R3325_06765 [Thermoanaerobaculia bacterium]|nr:hypothetical protein [Thermoanaerobaculia bacterium]
MTVAVIADCHIGGPGGPAGPLVEQLDELGREGRCRHLVLLGDLFHVWVGARQYETPEVVAVLEAVDRLRSGGVRVDYLEGNRDFFIAAGPYAARFDSVGLELVFESGGRRFLAVHGDGLDAGDWRYRFWRFASKNRLSRTVAFALPSRWTRPFIHGTERRLAETNFEHKNRIPEEVIVEYARRRLAEGPDLLLLGHFHDPMRWALPEGEVVLLEAWFHSRRIHWAERLASSSPAEPSM